PMKPLAASPRRCASACTPPSPARPTSNGYFGTPPFDWRRGRYRAFRLRYSMLVIPGRAEGANLESILAGGGYGFRAPSLRSGPGLTAEGLAQLNWKPV